MSIQATAIWTLLAVAKVASSGGRGRLRRIRAGIQTARTKPDTARRTGQNLAAACGSSTWSKARQVGNPRKMTTLKASPDLRVRTANSAAKVCAVAAEAAGRVMATYRRLAARTAALTSRCHSSGSSGCRVAAALPCLASDPDASIRVKSGHRDAGLHGAG